MLDASTAWPDVMPSWRRRVIRYPTTTTSSANPLANAANTSIGIRHHELSRAAGSTSAFKPIARAAR